MFTIEQIEFAHSKVKSGTDFPKYIQEIKEIGVVSYETWVNDGHTTFYGKEDFQIKSKSKYEEILISEISNSALFQHYLKKHQQGETDYPTFCKHCAETGIEKWVVNLNQMTCTYFDKTRKETLTEQVPE